MREIKFRAWDKEDMVLFEFYDLEQNETLGSSKSVDLRNCVIMQYIGKKDKKGKDIYEGDIVKTDDGHYEVIFNPEKACFSLKRVGIEKSLFTNQMVKQMKVIGNIYETPELLK